MVSAQTPFGFQDIDMSDYGLTVSLKDNNVVSCILHMYDRNVDIEYRKSNLSNSLETKSAEQVSHKIQNIIDLASGGLACAARNDIQGEWRNLVEMFNVAQDASGQLLDIPSQYCNTIGSAFSLLLSHRQIQENEDIARAVVDYAFYLLSRAIDYNPTAILYQKRISLVADSCSFFFYTVANALAIPEPNPMDIPYIPLRNKTNGYIYAMGKADFKHIDKQNLLGNMQRFYNLCKDSEHSEVEGCKFINTTVKYIEKSLSKYR